MKTMFRWDARKIECGFTASGTWKCAKSGQEYDFEAGKSDPERCLGCGGLTPGHVPKPEPKVEASE